MNLNDLCPRMSSRHRQCYRENSPRSSGKQDTALVHATCKCFMSTGTDIKTNLRLSVFLSLSHFHESFFNNHPLLPSEFFQR